MSKVVVETRRVEYPLRKKVHWRPLEPDPKDRWADDPGGVGVETVREMRLCPRCEWVSSSDQAKRRAR